VRDLRARAEHLRRRGYELFRMRKRFHRGGQETSTDETWSWRIIPNIYRAHEAMIIERAKQRDKRALLAHLDALRSMPMFAGASPG
jgi:hypothetical protein